MPVSLTAAELAEITSAAPPAAPGAVFTGVQTDSREVKPGNLFIALRGETSDGHNFLEKALGAGAALFLVENNASTAAFSAQEKLIKVSDTLAAYAALARAWRDRLGYPIIAITGSMGKTTARNMLFSMLGEYARCGSAIKSYNNRTGVPYTLCSFDPDLAYGITEAGTGRPGGIEYLSGIIKPDICVITCVAPAHIGAFGSLASIAKEKLAILSHAKEGCPLIVPAEDEALWEEMRRQNIGARHPISTFGRRAGCAAWAEEIENRGLDGIAFTLHLGAERIRASSAAIGEHSAVNFAIAALAARVACPQISIQQIAAGIAKFKNEEMRGQVERLGGRLIVNDAYNANAESVKAMLKVAAAEMRRGKKIGLLLGDIRELGELGDRYHLEVAEAAAKLKPQFCVLVGEFSRVMQRELEKAGIDTLRADSAADPAIADFIAARDYDALFVKGSRGVALERAIENLKKAQAPQLKERKE